MNRYRISQRAERDLEDIWIYVAQTDPVAADLLLAKILDKLPMLAKFPEMGRKRNDLAE
jgi:toxin ParE1/3/4